MNKKLVRSCTSHTTSDNLPLRIIATLTISRLQNYELSMFNCKIYHIRLQHRQPTPYEDL